jgi:uncharacterized protein YkwD
MSNRVRPPRKLFILLCFLLVLGSLGMAWRQFRPVYSAEQTTAAFLLPDTGQPLQFGAQLAPEAVEIGQSVTLMLVARNTQDTMAEPGITIQLPVSLQPDADQLDHNLLLNNARHTLHWHPQLAAEGGVAVREIRLSAVQPTLGNGMETAVFTLLDGEVHQEIALPIWVGLSLTTNAAFAVSDDTPAVGQQLQFTNSSTGQPPLSFQWDFGDGHMSTAVNPRHVYTAPGEYLVQLVVNGHNGQAGYSQQLTVDLPPQAQIALPQNIYAETPFVAQAFTDGREQSLTWEMGDGITLRGFWVEHIFVRPGSYLITLNAANEYGNSVSSALVVVQDKSLAPVRLDSGEIAVSSLQSDLTISYRHIDIQLEEDPEIERLPLTQQLMAYINVARQQAGVPPVSWSPQLGRAAQIHADDAALNFVASHTGSDGSSPYNRVERVGYVQGYLLGEATAWGFNTARSAVQFWLDSPEHRGFILSPQADQIGGGQASNYDSRYVWYWVVEVGSFQVPDQYIPYVTGTPRPTATATTTTIPTGTATATATAIATATTTTTVTATAEATNTTTSTPTPTPTIETTPTAEATATPSPTGVPTLLPTETATSEPTLTPVPSVTPEATPTVPPTETPGSEEE